MVVALVLAHLAAAPGVTAEERARLDKGEILVSTEPVQGSPIPLSQARAVIDAPPERVWPVVSECQHFTRTMPSIAQSALLKREGDVATCRVVADLPFPFADLVSVTRARLTVEPGVRWQRAWKLVEGDYTVNEGSFTLEPWGAGKTLATYRIDARPKMALPDWLIGAIQKDRLPELMRVVRRESGG